MSIATRGTWNSLFGSLRIRVLSFICATLLLLNIGEWFVYIHPEIQQYSELKRSLVNTRGEFIHLMNRGEIAKTFNRSSVQVSRLEKRLSQLNTQSDTIKNIISLAKNSDIKVISNNYEERKAQKGVVSLYQEIKLEGDYEQLKKFVSGLQQLPTVTSITEVNITVFPESKKLNATLSLETLRKS